MFELRSRQRLRLSVSTLRAPCEERLVKRWPASVSRFLQVGSGIHARVPEERVMERDECIACETNHARSGKIE